MSLNRRVRRYVARMTGMSRAQAARLIGSYVKTGRVAVSPRTSLQIQLRRTAPDRRWPRVIVSQCYASSRAGLLCTY